MTARLAAGLLAAALGLAPLALLAQAQPVQRSTLQQQEFPGPVDHTVMVRALVARGAEVPPHTHPGVEMAYVVHGEALVKIAGQPDQTLKPGGSFSVPIGVVHSVRNVGPAPLTLVSTYVVDKTKPLVKPVGQ